MRYRCQKGGSSKRPGRVEVFGLQAVSGIFWARAEISTQIEVNRIPSYRTCYKI